MLSGSKHSDTRVLFVGPLVVTPAQSSRAARTLRVPLACVAGSNSRAVASETADGAQDVRLFEDGVVWEDVRYELSFELKTTKRVRAATFCVNEHNESPFLFTKTTKGAGSKRSFLYAFEPDPEQKDFAYTKPFSLTCGFARVDVRITFDDDYVVRLSTPDIVSLDEPRRGGTSGESAEEANVRAMFTSLVSPHNNQAAEWMFSPASHAPSGGPLSSDTFTDWTHGALSLRLQVANEVVNLFDTGAAASGGAGALDADADALLTLVRQELARVRDALASTRAASESLYAKIERILGEEERRRGAKQSLPALTLVRAYKKREAELLEQVDELVRRADAAAKLSTRGARNTRTNCATDAPNGKLTDLARRWEACTALPLEREDVALHAIKPDRLFEYYGLWRMLDWLYRTGFRENTVFSKPIDRFAYSLAKREDWFQNEKRCANTFHVVREAAGSNRPQIAVDVYFLPVVYVGLREENGIHLHRVHSERRPLTERAKCWTPDYLLVVREGNEPARHYCMDAKYCKHDVLAEKLAACMDKYFYSISDAPDGAAGAGVDGVILLSGRLEPEGVDEAAHEPNIIAVNSQVSWRTLGRNLENVIYPKGQQNAPR